MNGQAGLAQNRYASTQRNRKSKEGNETKFFGNWDGVKRNTGKERGEKK